MKHPRLSAIFVAVSAASLLAVSTAGFAAHKSSHKAHKAVVAEKESYKGEANFKAEVPPPCPPVKMLLDGFYVGIGVGYDSYRFHTSSEFSDISVSPAFTGSSSVNSSATGWMGNIFAGYGRYFDWFYLAGEIFGSTSAAENTWTASTSDGDNFYAKSRARTSYGIAPIFGVKVNDSSLLYARVGWTRTDFKLSVNDGVNSGSANKWKNGVTYGVGIQTYVADNVSVRGEYDYTSYSSTTTSYVDPTNTFSGSTKFSPSNNEFNLALIYTFA